MSDHGQSIRDDLAFMRALAEDGARAPLLGGSILVAAGAVFAPASLAHWAVATERVTASPAALSGLWAAAMVVFLAALFTLKGRLRTRPGAHAPANQALSAAFGGLGLASFALFGAFMLASVRTGEWIVMAMFPPVILALYAAAWGVAAALSGQRWLTVPAGASALLAIGIAGLAGTGEQYLLYAAALVLVVLAPGLVLMRRAPADVI